MPTVREAPASLLSICSELERAICLVVQDISRPFPDLGRYESDVEVRVLFVGMLRHAEAIVQNVRTNLVLLSAGQTLARAVFEYSCKIRWLLHPTDVLAREARFLAHLKADEHMLQRCADVSGNAYFSEQAKKIRAFREAVERKLPVTIAQCHRVPNINKILTEVGDPKYYTAYIVLSQPVHGSHFAGSTIRRGLGTLKEFGEQTPPSAWAQVLQITWWSFYRASETIEHVCARRQIDSLSQSNLDRINTELQRLCDKPS